MKIKTVILGIMMFLSVSVLTVAAETNSVIRKKVDTLRQVSNLESGIEEVPELVSSQIYLMMAQGNFVLEPNMQQTIRKVVREVFDEKVLATNQLAEISYQLFPKYLSEKEMDLMIETYRSRGGQLIKEKIPLIEQQITVSLERVMAEVASEIQQRIISKIMPGK